MPQHRLLEGLTRIGPADAANPIVALFECIDRSIPLKLATIWTINARAETASVYARFRYELPEVRPDEYIRDLRTSFLGAGLRQIQKTGGAYLDLPDLLDHHFFGDERAQKIARALGLQRIVMVPIPSLQPRSNRATTAILNLYPADPATEIDQTSIDAIQNSLSNLLHSISLLNHTQLTNRILEIYAEHSNDVENHALFRSIFDTFIQDFISCEACSLLTWSSHKSAFELEWTSPGQQLRQAVPDDPSCLAFRKPAAARPGYLVGESLNGTLAISGPNLEAGFVLPVEQVFERVGGGVKSLLAVPIQSLTRDGHLLGVVRFVNRMNRQGPVVDYFDDNDVVLAKHLARLLSVFLLSVRHERERTAYTLQMAHELLAPSVAVFGTSDRLLRNWNDFGKLPNQKRLSYLNSIRDHAKLQVTLTRSVEYGWKRGEYPRSVRYRVRPTSLGDVIDGAKKIVIPICRSEGITFDNIRAMPPFPTLMIDRDAFSQVFFNLLTNAIKYRDRGPSGRFVVEVGCEPVSGSELPKQLTSRADFKAIERHLERWARAAHGAGDDCCGFIISVVDQGMGIQQENAERIFDVGFREEGTERWSVKGSGIGLSVVRNILADFYGTIWLEAPRSPTTFEIFLPAFLQNMDYSRLDEWNRVAASAHDRSA